MGELKITIPDAIEEKVIKRYAKTYGYQETIDDPDNPGQQIPNPQTPEEFALDHLKDLLTKPYRIIAADEAVEAIDPEAARKAAHDTAKTEADAVTLTRQKGTEVRVVR